MKSQYDVLIVGNGVLGYSTAFALLQKSPELRVTIVGPAGRPGGATVAAGAMLNSFGEIEAGALDSEPGRIKFDMSRTATKLWPAWVSSINRALGREAVSINLGTYVLHNARTDDLDDENFAAIVATLKRFGEEFSPADVKAIPGVVPAAEGRALEAIYIPGEGAIHPSRLLSALDEIFARSPNMTLIDDTAAKLLVRDSGEKEIVTANERVLVADKLVLAGGAGSQALIDQLPELKRRVPRLFYGIGTAMVLRTRGLSPDKVVRTPNRGMACGVHVVPYDKDVCYVGATNVVSPTPEITPRMTALYGLMQAAMEQVNARYYNALMERIIVGHRPTSADTFPLIGQTSIHGLFILSGTRREGIHISPLLGQSMALEVLGEKGLFEHPFAPERRLIHTMTKEEAIAKTVKHLKSSAYQHELHLPNNGWFDMIDDMLKREVELIYQMCQIKDFGIPPEMLGMYRFGLLGAA